MLRAGTVLLLTASLAVLACSDSTGPDDGSFQGCAVTPYLLGTSVSGALTASSCHLTYEGFEFEEYVNYYEFTLDAPRNVTLDMVSDQIDAYLIVWDRATGVVVTEDDDGGAGYDARIVWDFDPGSYVVGATSYAPGETGSYTLSSQ
jgi:hypothetical protein